VHPGLSGRHPPAAVGPQGLHRKAPLDALLTLMGPRQEKRFPAAGLQGERRQGDM
jgi:hypothetical protein